MTNYGPWSVKGIDQRAREAAREAAREEGLTIGEYINRMLLEETQDEMMAARDMRTPRYPRAVETEPEEPRRGGRGSFDQLVARLEAVEARSTLALTGIDQSIVGLVARLNKTDEKTDTVAQDVDGLIDDLTSTYEQLQDKVRALEEDETGARNLETLKSLEQALGRLSSQITEESARQKAESGALREDVQARLEETNRRFHERIKDVESRTDETDRQMAERFSGIEDTVSARLGRLDRYNERIDAVEGDVAGALTSIESVMTRMQERLQRAEATTNSALSGLEKTFESLDKRIDAIAEQASPEAAAELREQFEKRFEGLASELRASIETTREDMAREIEQAATGGASDEKVAALESSIEGLQKRMAAGEERSSRALESMTDQVGRISTAFDKRLRDVEARDPEDAVSAVREDMTRLSGEVSDRLEQFSAQNDEVIDKITDQMKSLADQFDSRVEESEQRSAAAIEQVGEQVASVAQRLQSRQDKAFNEFKDSMEASRKQQAVKLSDALSGVSDRIDEMQRQQVSAMSPVQKAITSLATRLEALEDFTSPPHADTDRDFEQDFATPAYDHFGDALESEASSSQSDDEPEAEADAFAQEFELDIEEPEDIETAEIDDPFEEDDFEAGLPDISELDTDTPEEAPEQAADTADDEFALMDEPEEDPLSELAGWDDGSDEARDSDIFGEDEAGAFTAADETGPEEADSEADALFSDDEEETNAAEASDEAEDEDTLKPEEDEDATDYLSRARQAAMAATSAQNGRSLGGANPQKRSSKLPLVAAVSVVALATAAAGTYFTLRGLQDDAGKPVVGSSETPARAEQTSAAVEAPEDMPVETAAVETPEAEAPLIAPLQADELAGMSDADEAAMEADLFEAPETTEAAPPAAPETMAEAEAEAAPAPAATDFASLPTVPDTPTLDSAAADGNPAAQFLLGEQRLDAGDYTSGPSLVRKAAEAGEPAAQYRLAKLHEKGLGVPKDLSMARQWTERAAQGGNVKAMHDLAVYYAEGEGGSQNYAAAVDWFRKAADYGLTDSQYNLAVLYQLGLGISPSQTEALYWYEVAHAQGDDGALDKVEELRESLSLEEAQQAQRRAAAWTEAAADPRANGDFDDASWQRNPQAQVSAIQTVLGALGYEPGPADGVMGNGTQEAIRAYQAKTGLEPTGAISPALVRSLNETVEARTRTG
ncbi:peptidoglycan-binding protein [Henriciella aquimarina]|uniref:peptidoglycan-binding protein n=1 Tax=Henriciella aquimarina TaxID=545261 RepID=UPI0009FC2AAE|nr:peptidoglycan-binding protein [Henriciella aquimarina]